MAKRSGNKSYLPSLLDRLADSRSERDRLERLQARLVELDRELQKLGDDAQTERAELEKQRREALVQLELLSSLTRTWDDIRECIRRDLEWLFNAHGFSPVETLESRPHCRRSVINYGLPDLTGRTAASIDPRELERRLEETIAAFEPRILRHTLKVRLDVDASDLDHNSLILEIQGQLWTEPAPLHLRLKSRLDLEDDVASVIEFQT